MERPPSFGDGWRKELAARRRKAEGPKPAAGQPTEMTLAGLPEDVRASLEEVLARRGTDASVDTAKQVSLTVSNELNKNVTIEAVDGSRFLLSPLEERRPVSAAEDVRFALRCWPGVVELEETEVREPGWAAVLVAYGIGFFFAFPWAILAAVVGAPDWWLIGWGALGGLILACLAIDLIRKKWGRDEQSLPRRLARWMRGVGGQQLYLLLGIFIGFVLPAAAIFFASDAWSLIDQLRSGKAGSNDHLVQLTLIGRLMQVLFVGIASLTPALLFFVFDREHLETLRRRFMRQIMRFDASVATRRQVIAKYGQVMDEAYGRDVHGKILPGRRSPLLLATLLIALGWTFTLLHGDVKLISERGIASLFEPRLSAVSFAFLGAYFYGLNVVLRGYVRKDLRAKTYGALSVRILIVVVLAWVLDLAWDGTTLYVLAFLTGIFPETALVLIKEVARSRLQALRGSLSLGGEESDPLTKLEGIDLYDLARLFDEGVTNVQGLAHDDVVELMLQTRIPAPRILDWVDQAILYLHAGPTEGGSGAAERKTSDTTVGEGAAGNDSAGAVAGTSDSSSGRKTTLATLRRYGIRTATDLFNAYEAAKDNDDRLEQVLRILPDVSAGATPRVQAMIDVLEDEQWLVNLQHWRNAESAKPEEDLKKVSTLHPGTLAAAYPPRGRHDPVETIDERTVRVDGWCSIEEFNERFHANLLRDGFHTVAGFVVGKLDRQPERGDEVSHDNYRFHVDELQDTLISRLTVTSVPPPEEPVTDKETET